MSEILPASRCSRDDALRAVVDVVQPPVRRPQPGRAEALDLGLPALDRGAAASTSGIRPGVSALENSRTAPAASASLA
ncbi:MAG: hypothetical protein U1F53_19280 [Burkholderiaceae bacterium]